MAFCHFHIAIPSFVYSIILSLLNYFLIPSLFHTAVQSLFHTSFQVQAEVPGSPVFVMKLAKK